MLETIKNFPKQFTVGLEAAKNIKIEKKYNRAVLCGMGGSIIPAEMLALQYSRPNIYINRSYHLPVWAGEEDLVICVSWSGDTGETLSSYENALNRHIPTVAITSGGKLKEQSEKNHTPLVFLPNKKIQPRLAVGFMYSALSQILYNAGFIEDQNNILTNLGQTLDTRKYEERAKELALKISQKTPLNYASYTWKNQAAFWKILFNENCKIHSFWNAFPGMAHNEIAGFNEKNADKFFAIILNDNSDMAEFRESIEKLGSILEEKKYAHEIIELEGKNKLEKIFFNYLLAALTSYFLAEILNIDPNDLSAINKFKNL